MTGRDRTVVANCLNAFVGARVIRSSTISSFSLSVQGSVPNEEQRLYQLRSQVYVRRQASRDVPESATPRAESCFSNHSRFLR